MGPGALDHYQKNGVVPDLRGFLQGVDEVVVVIESELSGQCVHQTNQIKSNFSSNRFKPFLV